ncbi:LAFA_0G03268g1_1 [Lachancea sp. 'fantastica']|nr:LAFA_0G03268g1_1 [Lachancea sp. 'fantastica']
MSSQAIPNVLVLSLDHSTEKLQPKRLRVPRACDVCRQRKVRCDGRRPCIHCTVYSHNCTYSPISRAIRKSRTLSNARESSMSNEIPFKKKSALSKSQTSNSTDLKSYKRIFNALFPNLEDPIDEASTDRLIELIERSNFQGLLDVKSIESKFLELPQFDGQSRTDSHLNNDGPAIYPIEMKIVLPPLDMAKNLVYKSWRCAFVLFRFNHRPTLIKVLESLYTTAPEDYSNEQNNALPLIYSILAVGALFTKDDFSQDKAIQDFFHQEGYKYFTAASKMIDITNVSDVCAIQTIFMMTIFLQCSAKLTTCYSLIGIALRAALRIGLHKKSSLWNCSLIEAEVRKRLFWTIYKMDVYVNVIMGLPVTIADSDIDQELPENYHDDDMTDEGIEINSWSYQISSCALSNEHTKLTRITKRIYDETRSHKKNETSRSLPTNEVVGALEHELVQWRQALPPQLVPGYEFVDLEETKSYRLANYFLNFDYLHATIMLYRPFIDTLFMNPDQLASRKTELELGIKCLKTAQQIVASAGKMCGQKILCGSYWFSVHTIFLGVTNLMYIVHQAQLKEQSVFNNSSLKEVQKDLKKGIDLLQELRSCSVTSERTFNVLSKLFEKFTNRSLEGSVEEFNNLNLGEMSGFANASTFNHHDLQAYITPTTPRYHDTNGAVPTKLGDSTIFENETPLQSGSDAFDPTLVNSYKQTRLASFFEDSYLTGMPEEWNSLFEAEL